ncbi:transcriptional regulator, TetR family [Streptomyces sp. yr375]|uniref:TetR family transcriptional regulator n=1 Tax=Streptomyces sp. yr375 TaxID=1761906 RepID=UPI0008CCB72B|nr:TetR family transcriptional regulator [Streptomyces sp. yr375]SER51242.1 transcriptional regulator, TetR family [Streptomyces sp. yr375]
MDATRRRAGRPRANGSPTPGLSTREEVLAVAARLFTTHGYTATTTRATAEGAGLRQASLYNHFGCKEEVLATLLARTVRPALAFAERLLAADAAQVAAEARIWALARYDVQQLLSDEYNLGALFLLPEIAAP